MEVDVQEHWLIISDCSSIFLINAIKAWGLKCKKNIQISSENFDTANQLINSNSVYYNVVIIWCVAQKQWRRFANCSKDEQLNFATNWVAQVTSIAHQYNSLGSKVYVTNLIEFNDGVWGKNAASHQQSFLYQIRKANQGLVDLSSKTHYTVLDVFELALIEGIQKFYDYRLFEHADQFIHPDFLPYLAKLIWDDYLNKNGTALLKCVIVDLDDTLWGGVIAEDGLSRIKLGTTGYCYSDFQRWLKLLKQRGIILAICSKNNEEDAKIPFLHHPEMELSLDDVTIFCANWSDKVENIRMIKQRLNIGFDSMVFIDDNIVEREWVKLLLPEVFVPNLPDDPVLRLPYLQALNLFSASNFTIEDEIRNLSYLANRKRDELKAVFPDANDFLKSLNMSATFTKMDDFNLPRIAQLSQRSNQFNVRTIRYNERDLLLLQSDNNTSVYGVTLSDKFGNYGLIAAVVLKWTNHNCFIENWFMSCRVLQRGLEYYILDQIHSVARMKLCAKIEGQIIPSGKNELVLNLYEKLGFRFDGKSWITEVQSVSVPTHFINLHAS